MKIIIDQKTVKRNASIGKILRWISLGCMLIGLIAVFSENIFSNPNLFTIFFSIMIVGVLLSSVSGFFTSRFGKSPRPDELIDKTFKGLDDRFHIFHYRSSIPHLLIGPAGLWSIIPTFIDGEIIYEEIKENWIHKRNSILNRLLQREYFPNPLSEYKHHKKELDKILKEKINPGTETELKLLILLLNKNVTISGISENDNILIMPFEKVKDRFRKLAKNNSYSEEAFTLLEDLLEIK